jgi:lipid-A-disaccharide synthase
MGANAHWFGHPIKELLVAAPEQVRGQGIAVLPGSRSHEIENNLPVIAKAVDGPVEFALAPGVDKEAFIAEWSRLRPNSQDDVFTVGDTPGVLRRASVAVVCSGTATLEAALSRTPMVVIYRASKAMEIEEKLIRFKRPKFISLPNIVLDRKVVPELIQEQASPESVRAKLTELREDSPERRTQLEAFDELDSLLGASDAISQAARMASDILTSQTGRAGTL